MKCKKEAYTSIKAPKAGFCAEHFLEYFLRQVERAITKFKMFSPQEPVLAAVSGGKDSLALWDALLLLGYKAEGLHIDLGLGKYSQASKQLCCQFAANRGVKLYIFSFLQTYSLSITEIARRTRRPPCSVCGVVKRHLINTLARQTGYRTVATGHNLDDEAATLMGNLLSWQEGYLARQHPHLPAKDSSFPARVKPLVRLEESEIRAYCQLRNLNFYENRCPLAKGASSSAYKHALNMLEEEMPGTKRRFLFGFWEKEQKRFSLPAWPELKNCQICGNLTTADVCLCCRLMQKAGLDPLMPLQFEIVSPADGAQPQAVQTAYCQEPR